MARPAKDINPIIAERIKLARKRTYIDGKKLTQGKLAELLFVSVQAVKNWEQGITSTDDDRLKDIAKICNVDFLWLKGLDAETIVKTTKSMVESTNWELVQQESPRSEAKSYALIYSLLMCGYQLEDICRKDQYAEYMEQSIKTAVEYFMKNLNKEDNSNEKRHDENC